MSVENNLKALRTYLRASGTVTLEKHSIGQLNQQSHSLTYATDGLVPYTWPVTGQAHFTFVWNDMDSAWKCAGQLFNQSPVANDPKTWLHQVARSVRLREQLLKSFFQQAMTYWERYVGDLEQFQYRLGIQLSSSGHMSRGASGFYYTSANDPTVQVFFSPDTTPATYGMPPRAKFGFYEPTKTHQWSLTVENMAKFRDDISSFSHDAREFCKGASSCLGATDFSDVEA